jgi:hypothetical protein
MDKIKTKQQTVALARTDISEEHNTSIIRVTRIGGLRIMLAITSY